MVNRELSGLCVLPHQKIMIQVHGRLLEQGFERRSSVLILGRWK